MSDFTENLEGRRMVTTVDGVECAGTISAVTFTPKNGDAVVALSLDEPAPSGKESVAVALDDLEPPGE